jgi:hypothetical protein
MERMMSIIGAIVALFRRLYPRPYPIDDDHPFGMVRCVFVPLAHPTNSLANLTLLGTECLYGDATYRRLEALTCDAYYPGGALGPLYDDGSLSAEFTLPNIGQLDLAFNDYLNFLIAFRKIYEANLLHSQMLEELSRLSAQTGPQGRAYSVFIDRNGGILAMLARCRAADERARAA